MAHLPDSSGIVRTGASSAPVPARYRKIVLPVLQRLAHAKTGWRPWQGLLALTLWLVALAGIRPLTLPDEGRYAGVAWDMFSKGAWLTPLIDGMPYFHKPPLYYWMASASYALFGANAWAARLPAAIAAVLAISGLYLFLKRLHPGPLARRTAVVLATTPLFYGAAQFANHDMLVAAFITLTVLAGAWALGLGDLPRARQAACAAALFAALAVLSKGLIGVVLPGATLAAWAVSSGHWRKMGRLLAPLPLLVFSVVAVPWFAVMQLRYPDFFHYFFIYQQFERFSMGGFNNVQPFWFYLPVIAAGCLPWTALALQNVWRNSTHRGHRALHVGQGASASEETAGLATTRGVIRLAWVWLAVVVVFFSIPGSKLVGYILPALPPLAILIVASATPAGRAHGSSRWSAYTFVAAALCVALLVVATWVARPGTAALGSTLARLGQPADLVVALERYPFDLNLLAHRKTPIWVVDDWADPELPTRDNWRKELFDAARFAAPEGTVAQLLSRTTLSARLCAAPVGTRVWLYAPLYMRDQDGLLGGSTLMTQSGGNGLWRFDKTEPCSDASMFSPQASLPPRVVTENSALMATPPFLEKPAGGGNVRPGPGPPDSPASGEPPASDGAVAQHIHAGPQRIPSSEQPVLQQRGNLREGRPRSSLPD